MVLLLVLILAIISILIDIFFLKDKKETKQEIFYNQNIGFTMADGGKPIKNNKKEKK